MFNSECLRLLRLTLHHFAVILFARGARLALAPERRIHAAACDSTRGSAA
jgi:hypothetical protein